MSHVVVISGHPNLQQSNTNKLIIERLAGSLDSVDVRCLDTLYPDYQIDVAAEQQALLAADAIVLQFPFYWYSVPALLKKWIDDVLAYDFAFGSKGDKLKGKALFLSLTVGGPAASYQPLGYNHFTIEQMLRPLQQTAYLAGMAYQPPIATYRMVYIPGVYNKLEEVQERAESHARRLLAALQEVLESDEERIRRFVSEWFEQFDQLPEASEYFTARLAADVDWNMPEGRFLGHDGFRDWYAIVRKVFKPGCDHRVEQVTIQPDGDDYQVELRIRLLADTFADSDLKGEPIDLLVNEIWQVRLDEQGRVTIHNYRVVPVG
ncbi:NAD(P)H-dependent oxidoreductase [Oceanimonas doudoroffii]|uniref:FMN reductase n=1 Tax=Oceanimonas doudoroffii TaxID=84158 RepID=A0A233RID8_9GAMM|nr:NAD(P)H-dependent oxidoreductase [Oceanimonas doudoroffii]OXY83144.1 FMN reductase [Oceanimonas doudoroffii]